MDEHDLFPCACRELYLGKPPFACFKVLAEGGTWTGKYHYTWREGFPGMPLTTPPAYSRMVQACLNHDPLQRPTFFDILQCLAELLEDTYKSTEVQPGSLYRS